MASQKTTQAADASGAAGSAGDRAPIPIPVFNGPDIIDLPRAELVEDVGIFCVIRGETQNAAILSNARNFLVHLPGHEPHRSVFIKPSLESPFVIRLSHETHPFCNVDRKSVV